MLGQIKIVLFEDTTEKRVGLVRELQASLGSGGLIVPCPAEVERPRDGTYEDRLAGILTSQPYEAATMILADRDLSKSGDTGFRGLSVNAVAAVADRHAIPLCSYAWQPRASDDEWFRWEDEHIVLNAASGSVELARQAVVAARGFAEIATALPGLLQTKKLTSPAKVMGALLERPEYSDKISLYGVGDQKRLPQRGRTASTGDQEMVPFLGYWLWGSLLRYPGLLTNQVAAASHLNIEPSDFVGEVQSIFGEALYRGPFAELERQWWRAELDEIVFAEDCDDGRALVQKRLGREVRPSSCMVDPARPAGYYCIISRKPVSLENSRGGLSWIPRGADLTRISTPKFEEYGPWMGA